MDIHIPDEQPWVSLATKGHMNDKELKESDLTHGDTYSELPWLTNIVGSRWNSALPSLLAHYSLAIVLSTLLFHLFFHPGYLYPKGAYNLGGTNLLEVCKGSGEEESVTISIINDFWHIFLASFLTKKYTFKQLHLQFHFISFHIWTSTLYPHVNVTVDELHWT